MHNVLAVVPVRGSSSAKTRLAPLFTEDERLMLVWAMLRRLVEEIRSSATVDHTLIVTRDAQAVKAHLPHRDELTVLSQHSAGLNGALEDARAWAVRHGYHMMLVLPGDLPNVGRSDIRALVEADGPLVVASDRLEEGTNALRLDLRCWRDVPFRFRMGPGSFAHHFAEATRVGQVANAFFRLGVAHDLDTPGDWADMDSARQRQLLEAMHRSLRDGGHLA